MKSTVAARKGKAGSADFFSTDVTRARRFFTGTRPGKLAKLAVVSGGLEYCTPDYAIERKTFTYHSIEYVVRGQGEAKIGRRVHILQPGRLFSYGPGIAHRITTNLSNPLVKYFVDFTGRNAESILESCGLKGGKVSQIYPANSLQFLFDELIDNALQVNETRDELCGKILECIALKIRGTQIRTSEGAETLAFETYHRSRQRIEQNFQQLRTLGQIAQDCSVNGAYLCRLFRRDDRQSPYQFLLRLKINFAAEQLQRPGSLVKQVAAEVGFSDPFHFSRVFKNVLGHAPDQFRRRR